MGVKNYRDLAVWQQAMELVVAVYRLIEQLPREEQFALGNQLRRAVVSIPSNIAEGFGRDSHKDFARFLVQSRGSLFEVGTQQEVASRLGYVEVADSIRLQIEVLSKMLGSFIRKLRESSDSPIPNPQSPSTKHQSPSTKHQAPSTKHQAL